MVTLHEHQGATDTFDLNSGSYTGLGFVVGSTFVRVRRDRTSRTVGTINVDIVDAAKQHCWEGVSAGRVWKKPWPSESHVNAV